MQLWLKKLNSVACSADDILDEFAYEVLRRKMEVGLKNKVRNFSSPSNPLAFRFKIAHKVKNINVEFDKIFKQAKDIGLRPAEVAERINAAVEPSEFGPEIPFVDKSKVVGRDGDVSKVIAMLLSSSDNDDLPVISIVGMAGLGKTTLAQLVYNDKDVVKNFGDQRMWICVSDVFKVERLLNEMVQSLPGDKSETRNIEGVVRKLGEKLNGKKYLLVLDDVWNTDSDEWERMRNSLLGIGGSKGSKIIVTTRSMEVVLTMQTSQSLTHQLEKLSNEDSWTMFRIKAFAYGGPRETPNLVAVGRRMVEMCEGVPLAIKSLGGLMHSKQEEQEWLSIQESEIWSPLGNENGILPALRLSFDHLPLPSLKQCFAYCSIFPKDFLMEKDNLIHLWMGQGYLQAPLRSNLEMEDVGNTYFNTLLHNSLFQDVELDEYNNITGCKMHDLVHDLALHVAENNCLNLKRSEVRDHPKAHEAQHISLIYGAQTRYEFPKENVGKLRTLFLTPDLPENFANVKCIRTLSLEHDAMDELPNSVSSFIHLRYLDISYTSIERLPNFITKLYNLQTLRLPNSLEELPKKFHKLVNLRHLYFGSGNYGSYVEPKRVLVPMMLGNLTFLQTLPFFVVDADNGRKIEQLGYLHNLKGKLMIYSLEKVGGREEAEKVNLSRKSKIDKLELYWSSEGEEGINNDENVLEGLQPHGNLKQLILEDFGGERFASWMMMTRRGNDMLLLHNLVTITLKDCRRCEQIPALGHLPYLNFVAIIGLHNVKRIGPEFYGQSVVNHDDEGIVGGGSSSGTTVFPALRNLSLIDMINLEGWSDISPSMLGSGTPTFFPSLEELMITDCPRLITIPCHLFSLQELHIQGSNFSFTKPYCRPYLSITSVRYPFSDIDAFLEDLLEKSSKSLRSLRIFGVGEPKHSDMLRYLPNNLKNLVLLEDLVVINCQNLRSIVKETEAFGSLQQLSITRCYNLTSIVEETEACGGPASLQLLSIFGCGMLTRLPWRLLQTLVKLDVYWCPNLIMAKPDELRSLTSLETLEILGPELAIWWAERLIFLTGLRRLKIGSFSKNLEYFPWPSSSIVVAAAATATAEVIDMHSHHRHLQQNPLDSLESLSLCGSKTIKSLPDQVQHLTALRELSIWCFNGLEVLPEWLGNLSSLQSLRLRCCKNLMRLPSLQAMQRLTNLQSLIIRDCPLLVERCKSGSGQEWHKISHIQSIEFE